MVPSHVQVTVWPAATVTLAGRYSRTATTRWSGSLTPTRMVGPSAGVPPDAFTVLAASSAAFRSWLGVPQAVAGAIATTAATHPARGRRRRGMTMGGFPGTP